MPKPTFDPEKILDFLAAYVAAQAKADEVDEVVKIKGTRFKVCPTARRKADIE